MQAVIGKQAKKLLAFIWEVTKVVIIAALIVVPIRYFLFQPFVVRGASMQPNFHSGDYLIVDELTYRFDSPKRGDVIVFESPYNSSQHFIKRIIGLPSEKVEVTESNVIIHTEDGEEKVLKESKYLPSPFQSRTTLSVKLREDEYFVMGDNRKFSSDSRKWGPVEREDIVGRAFIKVFPFSAMSKIENPSY